MRQKNDGHTNRITWLLLSVGVIFMILGIWREEYTIVMSKAVHVCLECIGIG